MNIKMKKIPHKHFGFFGKELSVRGKLFRELISGNPPAEMKEFDGKKAGVFSEVILDRFIEEDYRHGKSVLVKEENRSLRTFSNGEKRKALLQYLLEQDIDFLILDSPFDGLDKASVAQLKEKLENMAKNIPVIQLFRREKDILPFINHIFEVGKEKIVASFTIYSFHENHPEKNEEIYTIPAPPQAFEDIPEVLLKMENISVSYENQPILKDINWEVKKGEFWELTGPNGSGKTTLLSMIYGDNPKAYGQKLWLFGKKKGSGESVWEVKKKIGYFSPAITELFTRRNTVLEMLISGLEDSIGLYATPGDHQIRLAKEWLKILGLEQKEQKIFTKLSILQQRMVLIARAMIKHPPLLILDEPTTALDDESASQITGLINSIARESETAVIYVSHRNEPGLKPQFIFRLKPSGNGSEGKRTGR